jgi:hypothetical protein
MSRSFSDLCSSFRPFAVITLMFLAIPPRLSHAGDLLRLYVGGAAGQSQVEADVPYVPDFHENHSAFKFMAGIRPISLFGVEIAYDDFGYPTVQNGDLATDVTMKGESGFAVLYLPVPIVDIFLKAGMARIESTSTTNIVCPAGQVCPLFATTAPESRTNVGFAGGVGAQFAIGSFAVRGEYERFNAAGGNPSLLSVGVIWKF